MPYQLQPVTVKRPLWLRILTLGLIGKEKIVMKSVYVAPAPLPRPKPLLPKVKAAPLPVVSKTVVPKGTTTVSNTYVTRHVEDDSADDILPAMLGAAMLLADTPAPAPEPEFRSGGGGDFGGGGASATWGSDEPAGWKDYSQPSYEPSPAPAPAYEPPAPSPSYESSWSSSSDSSSPSPSPSDW